MTRCWSNVLQFASWVTLTLVSSTLSNMFVPNRFDVTMVRPTQSGHYYLINWPKHYGFFVQCIFIECWLKFRFMYCQNNYKLSDVYWFQLSRSRQVRGLGNFVMLCVKLYCMIEGRGPVVRGPRKLIQYRCLDAQLSEPFEIYCIQLSIRPVWLLPSRVLKLIRPVMNSSTHKFCYMILYTSIYFN